MTFLNCNRRFGIEKSCFPASACASAEGVTVGETSTLYYDRLKGALPSTSKLIFKAGLNRWESIQLKDMGRAEGLNPADGSEWWSVDIQMPKA